MKNISRLIILIATSCSAVFSAMAQQTGGPQQESLQQQVAAIAEGDAFGQAVVGICARTGDGRTLIDVNAEDMMTPASNMKLISTGTA